MRIIEATNKSYKFIEKMNINYENRYTSIISMYCLKMT